MPSQWIVYSLSNCSTCRNSLKWLRENGVPHEVRAIRETPPPRMALKRALEEKEGNLKALFNTSGMEYRALGMKDQLATMSVDAALDALAGNGSLVKRPFVVAGGKILIGFNEAEWRAAIEPTTAD